jgi:putative copper export protein
MIKFQSSMILFAVIFLLFSGGTHANDIVQNVRIVDVETGLISELKDY